MKKYKLLYTLKLFFICTVLSSTLIAQESYVNPKALGNNTGTDWTNAYTDLQYAIQNTASGELWVVAGTYYPTTSTDRSISFELKSNLALYGGFNGNETQRDQRDYQDNITILSGELGAPTSTDNSYNVVRAYDVDNTCVLDGFHITEGRADGTALQGETKGAGLLLDAVNANLLLSPRIKNCFFYDNFSIDGGAAIAGVSYNGVTMEPVIDHCYFQSNTSGQVVSGEGYSYGGALYFEERGSGAGGSSILIRDCWFMENNAIRGGAIFTHKFNLANQAMEVNIYNSLFLNNQAIESGGSIFFSGDGATQVVNSTFYTDNLAVQTGVGHILSCSNATSAHVSNSIIWGGPTDGFVEETAGPVITIENSIVKGGSPGTNVLDTDPMFLGAANGNFKLSNCSPAIDMGDLGLLDPSITVDLFGDPRIFGAGLDFGAFEEQGIIPENFAYATTGSVHQLTGSCTSIDGWTHYYDPVDPTIFLFSIEHNPIGGNTKNFSATPTITVTSNPTDALDFVDGIFKRENTVNKEALFALGRYWNVEISSGSLDGFVNIRFYFDLLEEATIEAAADAWILANGGLMTKQSYWVKTQGVAYDPALHLTPTNVLTSIELPDNSKGLVSDINYRQIDNITSFSGGTLVLRVSDDDPLLPVELTSFNATRITEKEVELAWKTSNELNNSGFEIQRRLAAESDFRAIDFVESQGNTPSIRSYAYTDANDASAWSYYRLKMINLDGQYSFSPVRAVKASERLGRIDLFPNPVKETLQVILPSGLGSGEVVEISVLNTLQQAVFRQDFTSNSSLILDGLDALSPGVYFLAARVKGQLFVEKFLKTVH